MAVTVAVIVMSLPPPLPPPPPPLSHLLFPSPMMLPPLRFLLLPRLVDCCLIVVVVAIAVTSRCRCWCHRCRFEFIVIYDRCRCCYCRCVTPAASWGVYPPNPGKKRIHLLGGLSSIRHIDVGQKASCGVLEGHFCRRQPWLWWLLLAVGCWGTSPQ